MSSEAFIQSFRKDPHGWRLAVFQLLRDHAVALPARNLHFLESLASRDWLEELSYLQAEWLLDVQRSVTLVDSFRGYSVKYLIQASFEGRLDLDEDDQAWIEELHRNGLARVRGYEASRAFKLACRLGSAENDSAA